MTPSIQQLRREGLSVREIAKRVDLSRTAVWERVRGDGVIPSYNHTCVWCGDEFISQRPHTLTCTPRCHNNRLRGCARYPEPVTWEAL